MLLANDANAPDQFGPLGDIIFNALEVAANELVALSEYVVAMRGTVESYQSIVALRSAVLNLNNAAVQIGEAPYESIRGASPRPPAPPGLIPSGYAGEIGPPSEFMDLCF